MSNESDDLDGSQVREQQAKDRAILEIRKVAAVNIHGDGVCIVCGATVEPVRMTSGLVIGRFCSVDCRDNY